MIKPAKMHFRSVWISDVHLGTKDCQADRLLDFLSEVRCEYLYLVGDIIDVLALRKKWHWPQSHNKVVRKILKRDLKGTHVIFVPGNHDGLFRDYDALMFGNVRLMNEGFHRTADGKKVLIQHGDRFDAVVQHARLITILGDWLYYVLLRANRFLNRVRSWFGRPYWSLSGFVKRKVKRVRDYVESFEEYLARDAREKGADVVVCGHIHIPCLREIDGVLYANCGDWVESLTAIVEHVDGRIELFDWKAHEKERRLSREGERVAAELPVVVSEREIPVGVS